MLITVEIYILTCYNTSIGFEVVLKRNILNLFIKKIFNVPLWIKQVMFITLFKEMKEIACEKLLQSEDEVFSTHIPTITYKGKIELTEHKCGLDCNIYNFLQSCTEGLTLLEISVNTFHSMEEIAKYYELCLEQSFVKKPESQEIKAMIGFISGKFRTGEYFKQKGLISAEQLHNAILENKKWAELGQPKRFGEILVSLGYIAKDDYKALMILKEEAKKRFILDYNDLPKTEITYSNNSQELQAEIEKLKKENLQLKQKMVQILTLIKKETK